METFLARYLAGKANIEDIHTAIDQWRFGRVSVVDGKQFGWGPASMPELHDWLGLLPSEYQIFYENEWKFARYLIHLKNVS